MKKIRKRYNNKSRKFRKNQMRFKGCWTNMSMSKKFKQGLKLSPKIKISTAK